jgi:hypothetical protein
MADLRTQVPSTRRGGRPRLREEAATVEIRFLVTPSEATRLRELGQQEDRSAAGLARWVVRSWMSERAPSSFAESD